MNPDELSKAISSAADEISKQQTPMIDLIGHNLSKPMTGDEINAQPGIFGLMYMEVSSELAEKREQYGFFAPSHEFPDGVFPKPVAATTEEEYAVWQAMTSIVTEPHSKARYADLLVQRLPNGRERYDYAKIAITAYREFALSDWPSQLDKKDAIARAYELAKIFKEEPVGTEIAQDMLGMAKQNIESDDPSPGVSMPLLETLAESGNSDTAEITRLNDLAIEKFAKNAFAIDSAHHVQELLTPAGNKLDLYRSQAQYFYDEAMKLEDGSPKLYELHKVEAFAELHGLKDITTQAIAAAEAIPFDSLNMKQHSVSFEVPKEQSDKFASAVTGDDSLAKALRRLGIAKAIQNYEENKATAEKQAAEHPMLMLFNSFNMGEANSIINSPESQEEKLDDSIVDNERYEIMEFSVYALHAIDSIVEKYEVTQDTLAAAFECEMIDANEAKAIARGFMHYVNGDADSAVKCLAPIAERLLRQAARSAGIPTTKLPNAKRRTPGGVRGLGEILSDMEGFVTDEDLRRYWRNALVDIKGHNLRNRSGHGLTLEFDKPDAAVVIHLLCTMLTLKREAK